MDVKIAAATGGVTDILRETADTFGWNWKLFLSQVISFCIVAFLLRRFAYKPILAVLEDRRRKIEEGQLNAEKIRKELAEAEKRYQEIVAKANADAQRMIDEARESSAHLAERKQQEAIAAAEQIVAKAKEAAARRSRAPGCRMKINKEIRQLSRGLLRASFTDGQLDRGKIAALVQSLI